MPRSQMSSTRFLSESNLGNLSTVKKTQMKPNPVSSSSSESHSADSSYVSLVRKKLESNSNSIQSNKDSKQLLDSKKLLTSKESDIDTESSLCEIPSDDRKSVLDIISRFSNPTTSAQPEKDGKYISKELTLSTKEGPNLTIADAKTKSVQKKLQTETDNNKITPQVASKKSNVVNLDERNSSIKETPKFLNVIKSLEQTSKTELEVSKTTSSDGPKRFSAIKDTNKTKKTQLTATDSGHTDTLNFVSSDAPRVLSSILIIENTKTTAASSDQPKRPSSDTSIEKTAKTSLTVHNAAKPDGPKRLSAIKDIQITTNTALALQNSTNREGLKRLSAIKDKDKTAKAPLSLSEATSSDAPRSLSSITNTERTTKTQLDVANSTSENTLNVLSVIKSIESGQKGDNVKPKIKSNPLATSNSNFVNSQPRITSKDLSQKSNSVSLGSLSVPEAYIIRQSQTKETKETMSSKATTTQKKTDASNHIEKISSERKDGAISHQCPEDVTIYEILPSYEMYEILPSPETPASPIHLYNNLPSQVTPVATVHNYINYNPNLEKGCAMVLLFDHEDAELVRLCIKDNVHRLKEAGGQILALNSQFCLLPESDTAALFIYFTNVDLAQTWLQHVQTHDLWLTNLCWAMVGENSQNRGRPTPVSEYKALSVTLMKRRRKGSEVNDSDLEQFRVMSAEVVAPMKEKHGGRTLVSARTVAFISGNWSSLDVKGEELSFVVTQWPNLENFKRYRRSFNANEDLTRFYELHEKLFSKVLTAEFAVGEVDSFQTD